MSGTSNQYKNMNEGNSVKNFDVLSKCFTKTFSKVGVASEVGHPTYTRF